MSVCMLRRYGRYILCAVGDYPHVYGTRMYRPCMQNTPTPGTCECLQGIPRLPQTPASRAALYLSAVVNTLCATPTVTCISFSKRCPGHTFSLILIDSLAGCFHNKKFIKHFQRTHFLSSYQDSILYIVLNTMTDDSFSF